MSTGGKDAGFVLYKPSIWHRYIVPFLKSESFAWGCQNALGVLFTILFAVVTRMTFTLACIIAALYGASSQILSLDRSVGGRLFGGTIFVGCILSGGIAGFAIVSLSWLARGSGVQGVLEYLPGDLQEVPSRLTIGELKVAESYLQSYLTLPAAELDAYVSSFIQSVRGILPIDLPLPPPSQILQGVEELVAYVESLIPGVDTAYWVLLIILYFVMSFPFAFSRGVVKSYLGLVLAISTLFMSSQVVFGSLMPIFGQRLFWTQVTGGYLKVGLVNACAMIITGCFIFVQSAHDNVRIKLGDVLLSTGRMLSSMASSTYCTDDSDMSPADDEDKLVSKKDLFLHQAKSIAISSNKVLKNRYRDSSNSSTRLHVETFDVESALVSCLFEPPFLGLSSQPGSNRSKYDNVLKKTRSMISVIANLETSLSVGTRESRELLQSSEFQSILNQTFATAAAVLSQASIVLKEMPVGKKCYGPSLTWRPKPSVEYETIRASIMKVYDSIENSSSGELSDSDLDRTGIPEKLIKGYAALLTLTSCSSLLDEVEALESAIADALEIHPKEAQTDGEPKSIKEKIMQDAYAPSIIMHTLLMSSFLVWGLIVQGLKISYDYALGSLSKSPWKTKREIHFALKYWIAISLAVTAIILIFWQGKGDDANPVQGYGNMADFFFNWQPVYFTITACICIQMQVESSAGKAVLRTLMTFLGGLFGYLTMLNGNLAQNPYFITCITCLFNGVCGLLSPLKELRYSLFLTAFTYNAVVICQYYGCCDIAGEAVNFGGKVVSTMLGSLYAIIVSWCILPFYTSEKMLDLESTALTNAVAIVQDILDGKSDPKMKGSSGQAKAWEERIQKEVYEPLTVVVKEYKANTIDKKQFMLLTYTLLPTPPVVVMALETLGRMTCYLRESTHLMMNDTIEAIVEGNTEEKVLNTLLQNTKPQIDLALLKAKETAEACCKSMTATSSRSLKESREEIRIKNAELAEHRAIISDSFTEWFKQNSVETGANVRYAISIHLLFLAIREVQVMSYILSEVEEATDRDFYFSWLSSWFGRRPLA